MPKLIKEIPVQTTPKAEISPQKAFDTLDTKTQMTPSHPANLPGLIDVDRQRATQELAATRSAIDELIHAPRQEEKLSHYKSNNGDFYQFDSIREEIAREYEQQGRYLSLQEQLILATRRWNERNLNNPISFTNMNTGETLRVDEEDKNDSSIAKTTNTVTVKTKREETANLTGTLKNEAQASQQEKQEVTKEQQKTLSYLQEHPTLLSIISVLQSARPEAIQALGHFLETQLQEQISKPVEQQQEASLLKHLLEFLGALLGNTVVAEKPA